MDRDEALNQLINLRAAGANHPAWHELETGKLTQLAPTQAIPSAFFNSLKRYEQLWIRAVAVGRGKTRAILIGRSSARVHGMWVVSRTPELVETTFGRSGYKTAANLPKGESCRKLTVPEEHIQLIDGTRTLSPFRTAADIAATHGFIEGLVAMSWLKYRNMSHREMVWQASKLGPIRGIRNVRAAIEASSARSLSPFEAYAQGLFMEAGIEVRMHVRMPIDAHRHIEVDLLAGPRGEVVVEIDGAQKYDGVTFGGVEETLLKERERENLLKNFGYPVVRLTPHQLLTKPDYCITTVAAAISREQRRRGR